MINYIRHDEECYFNVKLISGDEIIGKGFASVEEDTNETLVYIQDPLEITVVIKEDEGKMSKGVGLNKWINFSDEDFYIISEKDIISIAPLSREGTLAYKRWLRNELDEDDSDDSHKTDIPKHLGGRGSVRDLQARGDQDPRARRRRGLD